ncbi:MAG: helix-turn-helix domain-containing protein [Clostridiales bacterium]|nr:helix-turn-helix domain-containing protein [Clostridiales bacterium]NLK24348.1 MerR family transcriptional regulator [Clostridiales bacterium]
MFRIGEFSKLTQVSIRMLRYYDEKGLLKPAETDKFTGYRMYSASQIPMLQKIILLRDSRFSTEEIKKIIIEDKEVNIANELQKKKLEIQKEIAMEQNRIKNIDKAISEINRNSLKMHCNINFKKVDKLNIVSIRDIIPTYFDEHMAEAPSRQICHIGAGDTKNPDEYLTEIQIPIK